MIRQVQMSTTGPHCSVIVYGCAVSTKKTISHNLAPLVSGPYEATQTFQHLAGAPAGPKETCPAMAGVWHHPLISWLVAPLYLPQMGGRTRHLRQGSVIQDLDLVLEWQRGVFKPHKPLHLTGGSAGPGHYHHLGLCRGKFDLPLLSPLLYQSLKEWESVQSLVFAAISGTSCTKSSTFKFYSIGPSTEPYGTEACTGMACDASPLMTT
ncbi:hypothetical protein E2C01_031625 [Portunus trituberculatus]|uniref:Uncharacterized protein n=1 Tax=Portunus trituberculatus TaxID=210409 RepID=A0A5B7EZ31_PORTR|nr:hypothetical protein [Portunus trituberculatus]